MSDQPDAYKVLQVDPEADPEIIQAAYRRLAQKFHPDRAGGSGTPEGQEAARRMVAINAAWEVLGDERRRAAYDRERAAARAGTSTVPSSTGSGAGPGASAAPGTLNRASHRAAPDARPSEPDRLTFGRYAGWRLEEILRADPGYLEWLDRTPAGRPYRAEIDALLRRAGVRPGRPHTTGGLPRRS